MLTVSSLLNFWEYYIFYWNLLSFAEFLRVLLILLNFAELWYRLWCWLWYRLWCWWYRLWLPVSGCGYPCPAVYDCTRARTRLCMTVPVPGPGGGGTDSSVHGVVVPAVVYTVVTRLGRWPRCQYPTTTCTTTHYPGTPTTLPGMLVYPAALSSVTVSVHQASFGTKSIPAK